VHTLINGQFSEQISVHDRGLLYGDGCFETIRLSQSIPVLLDLHLNRLQTSLVQLGIAVDMSVLNVELQQLIDCSPADGILKIIVTRGIGGRGYRPYTNSTSTNTTKNTSTRILQYFPFPADYLDNVVQGIAVTVCKHRLSISNSIAGMKHLNRLDQVLASREVSAPFEEGLCLDQSQNVIEGTRSNLLVVIKDRLITPDLTHAGVRGVMLQYLSERFAEQGERIEQRLISLNDLARATEIFLCNSVFGVWPVIKLVENDSVMRWSVGTRTQQAIQFQDEVFNTAGASNV
jgi:4-amino-4-deoxychorismate lyase